MVLFGLPVRLEKTLNKKQKLSKRQQLRAARRRRQLIQRAVLIGLAVLVIGGITYLVVSNRRPGTVAGERTVATEGQAHISPDQEPTYINNPPSSGPHVGSATAPSGFSSEEIPPKLWVHNLEHGYIVLVYHCPEDCPDLKEKLESLAGNLPPSKYDSIKVVVTSYASPLPGEVTALAWTKQLDLPAFDEELLTQFYERWVDRGPEDVP